MTGAAPSNAIGADEPLIFGDPYGKGSRASYCRFILPFAYNLRPRPDELTVPPDTNVYRRATRGDALLELLAERWAYFTPEAASGLLGRSGSFVLGTPESARNPFCVADAIVCTDRDDAKARRIRLACHAPCVILLEMPEPGPVDCEPRAPDPLHTGFLIVDMFFPDDQPAGVTPTLADLMAISERFRFLTGRYDDYYKLGFAPMLGAWTDEFLKACGVADSTERAGAESMLLRWSAPLRLPVQITTGSGSALFELVSTETAAAETIFEHRRSNPSVLKAPPDAESSAPGWIVHADNRAFTVMAAFTARAVADGQAPPQLRESIWEELLNVDAPAENYGGVSPFHREWVQSHTYARWAHASCLYGFTAHSCVQWTNQPPAFTCSHLRTVYFDLLVALLYNRTVAHRFREAIADVALAVRQLPARTERTLQPHLLEYARLRLRFIEFLQLHRFPIWSNQQQAEEMIALARRCLDVDARLAEVQHLVDSAHAYLQTEFETRRNTWINAFKWIALVAGFLVTVASLDGVLLSPLSDAAAGKPSRTWLFLLTSIAAILATWLYARIKIRPVNRYLEGRGREK